MKLTYASNLVVLPHGDRVVPPESAVPSDPVRGAAPRVVRVILLRGSSGVDRNSEAGPSATEARG